MRIAPVTRNSRAGAALVVCAALFLALQYTPVAAQTCKLNDPDGIESDGIGHWGWAACIDWLAEAYYEPSYYQEWVVNEFVCTESDPGWYSVCNECGFPNYYCDYYAPSILRVHDMMRNHFRFAVANWKGPPPATSAGAQLVWDTLCETELCYMYAAFGDPSSLSYKHAAVVYGIDAIAGLYTNLSNVYFMDPTDGVKRWVLHEWLVEGPNGMAGTWSNWFGVCDFDHGLVGIGDIGSFDYLAQTSDGVRVSYRIQHTAEPDDSAAVYVSDNWYGPARLVRRSARIPEIDDLVDPPEYNYFTHHVPGYIDQYYYFLIHGRGPFPDSLSPSELYANSTFPVFFDGDNHPGYIERPTLDPPSNLTALDVPLDDGTSLQIQWQLSADDPSIHAYNIYKRATLGGFTGEFQLVSSVPAGASAFTDSDVVPGIVYEYSVSAAHFNGWPVDPAEGQYALWNDFSDVSSGVEPIDDFRTPDLEHYPADPVSLFTCPQGDEEVLGAVLTISGSDGSPTTGVPAEDMELLCFHEGLYFCDGDIIPALFDTDSNGQTYFAYSEISGCGTLSLVGTVRGRYTDTLTVFVHSPDSNADGLINLIDLTNFSIAMNSGCTPPDCDPCFDYDGDGLITLVDLTLYSAHDNHQCQ